MDLPWWFSIGFFVVSYVGMRFVIPAFLTDSEASNAIGQMFSRLSWFSLIFLVWAGVSAIRFARKRKTLDTQSGIESIRALTWKRFEELLGEAYRRQGYSVSENSSLGADGGIDLTIRRDGAVYLVQCKQWLARKVGVKVVREMFGLITAHHAAGAIIVTSGNFTKESRDFAAGKPIELVDGGRLVEIVQGVQMRPVPAAPRPVAVPPHQGAVTARSCPACGNDLVLRVAKRGPKAGGKFWGCQGYPKCRHTEEYVS